MYKIEIQLAGVWELASSHSQSEDRETQKLRFLAQGIVETDLRYTES